MPVPRHTRAGKSIGGASSSAAPAAPEPARMRGEAPAAPTGQPAVVLALPDNCRRCWGASGTVNQMKINPAYRPFAGNGSERYRVA
eukprot:5196189-Pyramimonas_sp.AAC.1